MTRTTAQVMEWRDPVAVEKLEAYSRGWWHGYEHAPMPHRTTPDYRAGYDHGFEASVRALSQSAESEQTQPPKAA